MRHLSIPPKNSRISLFKKLKCMPTKNFLTKVLRYIQLQSVGLHSQLHDIF